LIYSSATQTVTEVYLELSSWYSFSTIHSAPIVDTSLLSNGYQWFFPWR